MATLSAEEIRPQRALGEVARLGKEIYQHSLRAMYEPTHIGEYLVIDVESGQHWLIPRYEDLARTLHELGPNGSQYLMRIGYEAVFRMGGGRIRRTADRAD